MPDFAQVAALVFEQMKSAGSDWQMCWHGKQLVPINIEHGRPYSGVNRLLLWARQRQSGYKSRYWGTFNQWRKLRQSVAAGQRATTLVMPIFATDGQGQPEVTGFTRFWVFNGDQVLNRNEDHPELFPDLPIHHRVVEAFVAGLAADIRHGHSIAAYYPAHDYIVMPHKQDFIATRFSTPLQNYYSTLLHELVHWSGHGTRCARACFCSDQRLAYAFEELVAELGAAFLCAEFELEDVPRRDHAQYLNGWLSILDEKPFAFWRAASLAQQAADYLLQQCPKDPEYDEYLPDWFQAEPVQPDMFAPRVLGTGRR
jgi:antirestriction protein ArdC